MGVHFDRGHEIPLLEDSNTPFLHRNSFTFNHIWHKGNQQSSKTQFFNVLTIWHWILLKETHFLSQVVTVSKYDSTEKNSNNIIPLVPCLRALPVSGCLLTHRLKTDNSCSMCWQQCCSSYLTLYNLLSKASHFFNFTLRYTLKDMILELKYCF